MTASSNSASRTNNLGSNANTVDDSLELLMRHSSPLDLSSDRTTSTNLDDTHNTRSNVSFVTSPGRNNSSPSPLRLNRPRSNPRNRTPNRASIVEEEAAAEERVERRVLERQEIVNNNINHDTRVEGRRMTIRPMSIAAVGTDIAGTRIRETIRGGSAAGTNGTSVRSRKQGPSHRKVRRWNNDNFVNLAAEINKGGSMAAAEALLLGSNNVNSKYRSILDPQQHESKAMAKFRQNELSSVRQKFFNGELPNTLHPTHQPSFTKRDPSRLSPEERFLRIEGRLRRVITKACENSFAASQVVNIMEEYLIRIHANKEDSRTREEWLELLLEPPTVTRSSRTKDSNDKNDDNAQSLVTRFLFDYDSSTGGFHRLLLHGVCQYHGLTAVSSTMTVSLDEDVGTKKARVLTATGVLSGANDIGLVDFITSRQGGDGLKSGNLDNLIEKETNKLATLRV